MDRLYNENDIKNIANAIRIKAHIEPSGRLPEEYQEVEYIQSDGNQYIDTGVSGGSNANYEIKIDFLSVARPYEKYFSGDMAITTAPNLYYGSTWRSSIVQQNAVNDTYYFINLLSGVNVYKYDKLGNFYINGTLQTSVKDLHGTTISRTPVFTTSDWGTMSWYIFSSHSEPNLKSSMKLYYLKMFNGDTILRDFIPCYRKTDNKPRIVRFSK